MRKVLYGETILAKAKKIPVPEPGTGTGEIVTIPVEVLSAWMKLNHRKVKGWTGNILLTVPDVETELEEDAHE